MPTNYREFVKELRAQGQAIPAQVFVPWFREISFRLLELTAQATPRDTGGASQGWHLTINAASGQDVVAPSLGAALAAGAQQLLPLQLGDTVVLQNNRAHIRVLEEGLFVPPNPGPSKDPRPGRQGRILVRDGYSVQAPHGMLGDALQTVRTHYGL